MFRELRNMRMKLNLYYTLLLVLFISLVVGIAYFNVLYTSKITTDRDLKVKAALVRDLDTLPDFDDTPPKKDNIPVDEEIVDPLFKYILRDENMDITQFTIQNQGLFQEGRKFALQSWLDQEERWDIISLQGIDYRIFSTPFHNNEENGVVQTYCNLTMINKFISKFTNLLIATGVASILAAALLGWWLAGRAMMPVRHAWQRQREFIADVSHELRTPLTVVQSNLDVALADQDSSIKDNIDWLQNAYSETENMGQLINNLLFIARIDAREIKFNTYDFNLSDLLNQLISRFEPLFQSKNLIFTSAIAPNVIMHSDEVLVRQLVSIFLDNASKYTPAGGTVSLKMCLIQNTIEISVTDSGIGIDDSEQEKIFRRFYRIDKARSRKQGGTGLGLAIAAWIASEHRGQIQVFSKLGEGSTFKVHFPKGTIANIPRTMNYNQQDSREGGYL
ncbi:histidine kinase [Desulfosporosinus orientis DSM 765]|uniref:histidine kinase n=1 Tax=Desulfosporosinus orientis (strain ATCC 19365 / DSM 765 / NCIMB 8382 / VKM B-1628 / Singapore I) TaxID=768706 RepID=G7WIV8_DESOD|nr:ATP-binding protein [Desulfosporosinus orientis]AET69683.1 histidine kinase [Desulfosporosinus orientis DSM 765]